MPGQRVRVLVVALVAQVPVGGDHGGEPVAVGVRCVGVAGADRAPVGSGDLGAAGAGVHAEHHVGVGWISTHDRSSQLLFTGLLMATIGVDPVWG